MIIFLDESGDLGWSFGAPYRYGGSSRYLTISAVCVSEDERHLPGRMIRELYKKFSWDPKIEKKWSRMTNVERIFFAQQALKLKLKGKSLKYYSITAYKPKVQNHIRQDSNKLYNYLIKRLLLDEMALHEIIYFYPDPRNIKITSGNSLSDYLQTELFFTKNVATKLITVPNNSVSNKGIQFCDMLSGLIQHHFENNNSEAFKVLQPSVIIKTYYFEQEHILSIKKEVIEV